MGNIHIVPAYRGHAEITNTGIKVALHYEGNPTPSSKRMPADAKFGADFYDELLKRGRASLATATNPSRSPSAGAMYILGNGKFFSNRRDSGAKVHPLQHSLYTGFPSCPRQTRYPAETVVAEGAELVLVTKEKPYRLIVAKDDSVARVISIDCANRIGVDTSTVVEADFEYEQAGPDTIEIYEGDDLISRTPGFVSLMWEAEAALNIYQICRVHFDPENITPMDTEGWFEGGAYNHLNRETFVFGPDELRTRRFGDGLESPIVYKSRRTESETIPELQTEEPPNAPYILMPDDQLSRMLFGTGIWEGSWLEHFRDFHANVVRHTKS